MSDIEFFTVGSPPPDLILTDARNAAGQGTSTTLTFTSHPIGAAAADRLVIVVISVLTASSAQVTSATIGGVSASLFVPGGITARAVCIFWAVVPTGTTTTVVTNWSLNVNSANVNLATYSLTGQDSSTPVASAGDLSGADLNLGTLPDESCVVCGVSPSASPVPAVLDGRFTNVGSLGAGALAYGQINEAPAGAYNLSFSSYGVAAAVAWR